MNKKTASVAQVLREAMNDKSSTDTLRRWQKSVLFEIASITSAPENVRSQVEFGMWPLAHLMQFPSASDFKIFDDRFLLVLQMDSVTVTITLHLQVGDVSITATLPNTALLGGVEEGVLASASGLATGLRPTMASVQGATRFQWRFSNTEWTDFTFMRECVASPIESSILSARIATALMQIMLSIHNVICTANSHLDG